MSIEKNEKQYIIFPKSKSSDNFSESRITDERVFPNTRTNKMTAPILIPTSYPKSENDLPNITYQIYENKKDFESKKAIEDNIKEIKNEISRIETFVEKTPNESFYGDQLKELEIELESEQSKLNKIQNKDENENENFDLDSFFLTRTEDIEEKSKELGNKLKEQFGRSSNAVKKFENYNNTTTGKKGGKRRKTRKSTNKKTHSKKQKGGISNDEKLLITAAKEGNTNLVGKLLDKGVQNVYDSDEKYGSTALITAIQKNHTEIAKMILEKDSWNARAWDGTTALMEASRTGNTEIVKLLLEKGADVNKKNKYGSTALMNATHPDHKEILLLLLEHGADVNAKNNDGDTALTDPSIENYTEIVSLLLEHGADVHNQNKRGETPLSYAKYYKSPESSKILQEHIDKQKLEQEQEASRQIQGIAKQIQKAAKYIEKAAEQIGPQHKVPEGLKENLGGKRKKTRKSTNKKKNKKTRNKKPQFLYNPNDPKKSFDVYIDKNPDDTISIKYTTVNDVKLTIQKLERLYKSGKYPHKRIWQVGMIMYVRLNAMLEHKKKLYPNAKNVEERYELSKKYFIFLGHRTQEKNETKRKKMSFKF